jgi:co-chaperonin GroES (HSP10)
MLAKIPDETNVVISHEKNDGLTSSGILYTEDINPQLKAEAGNIIKVLKSQNLI